VDKRLRDAIVSGVSVGIMVFALTYMIQPAVEKAIPE